MAKSKNPLIVALTAGLLGLANLSAQAQVSPAGGTFLDKAIITEAGGGETLARATAAGAVGPDLVHNFDAAAVDPSYTITPASDATPTPIGLSSGRHLVIYSTRFDASAGTNRNEMQSNLNLAGTDLAIGRSQGYTRRAGGADEAVMSGGAIINVAADDAVLQLESFRSDTNTSPIPAREPNGSSIQLLRLDDSWDYLSLERSVNQGGTVGTTAVDVTYDINNSAGTMGTAFGFTATSGDITLNEGGLYLVFANTGVNKANNNTRTSFQQFLTLDGSEVPGSKTTTYVRGNQNGEDANSGVTAIGMILSATAGQVLNVELIMESGGSAGTIQGGSTAITMVKLPLTAKYIEVTDTTNQNINTAGVTALGFDTQSSPNNADFTHSGGSTVTVNATEDYLFFASLFNQSDGANDNHDRTIPLHGFQIDGAGGPINRGIGASYNRDNGGNRTSGSWTATLLELASGQTVEMTSQNLGTAPNTTVITNTPVMQGLNLASLMVSNDPAISVNLPLTVLPDSTGNVIDNTLLDTFDNDTAPSGLTYTVDSAPTGGTLRNNGAALGMGGTFTQEDIDNNLITFDGGSSQVVGGFDFTVSDGSASDSSSFVVSVEFPTVTVTISDDGDTGEGGVTDFFLTSDAAPQGADMTVTVAYSGSATSGDDFTAVTSVVIADGAMDATINLTALVDGMFEGTESVTATIVDITGATVNGVVGSPGSATILITDSGNNAPSGTNLNQVVAGTGNVPLNDIVVFDGDKGSVSDVSTAGTPVYQYNGIADLAVYGDGRADTTGALDLDATGPALSEAAGFSVQIKFTPQAADLTDTKLIWEIGGSSNGSAILLLDGVLHLLCKANGAGGHTPVNDNSVPGAFNDLDWGSTTDNTIVVPLDGANVVTPGLPICLSVIMDIAGNSVTHSVNGAAPATATLVNLSGTNFRGDHSVRHGVRNGGVGGSNSNATSPFLDGGFGSLASGTGAISETILWNESSGSLSTSAGTPDVVTATLTIDGWAAGAGDLTATSGNGETYNSGVWSITGTVDVVNAALAAVEFVSDVSTADPTTIDVALEDGDEDGGGPTTGKIFVVTTAPDPIYVDDDFAGDFGDPIVDGDLGEPGNQAATLGLSAFSSLADALTAVSTTTTIIVNDGDYSTENITLADMVTLQLTTGPVQIGDIATGTANSIDLGSNTLEIGATNISGPGIDCTIIGAGGSLTKVGSGRLVLRQEASHTGTTTITDGFLRIGHRNIDSLQSELSGSGPVVVTAPGRLELNVDVDKTITQTGAISGTGSVGTLGDGTVVFDAAGPNTFSGGFELGDGATSSFDGVNQGAIQGFVVVNRGDHLGTGKVLSRGSQLRAGTPGLVIPNDIDITGGGFRCGGTIGFELSGNVNPIDNSTRGYGNYGLEGCDLVISGNITMTSAGTNVNFEGSNNRDNGTWTITGDISGPANVLVQGAFDDGVVTFAGNNTYTGATTIDTGTLVLDGSHTGGGNYSVNNIGRLAGSGSTTSAVTITGAATLAPGTSTGTLTTGNLTINGTLEIEADNNTPGTGHDQVIANGTVTLGAASQLVLIPGTGLTLGNLTLIDNDDSGDPVTGTFAGLAEGGSVDSDALGLTATITYAGGGGDANDVALNFGGYTVLGQWRADYFGSSANSGPGENSAMAANGLTNLQSFSMDLDPTAPAGVLDVDTGAGTILSLGPPTIWTDPANGRIYLRHTRRTDFASIPLTITDQFSRNPGLPFEDSAVAPAVIATGTGDSGAAIEAVETEFPFVLPISGGKGRYGRVDVTTP